MFLITDSFPYGPGESSFILPELKWLDREFDVSIISCGNSTERTTGLPANIGVYRCPKNKVSWATGCVKAIFDPMLYREICRAFKDAKHPFLAVLQCIDYYGESESFAKQFRAVVEAEGIPDIVYCYWHRPALLGVLRTRKSCPEAKIITRAHGYDLFAERYTTGYIPYKQEADQLIDRVYLACRAGLDYYNEHYSVSEPPKSRLAYLGTDNSAVAVWAPSDTLRLISCSNIVEGKRIELLVDALSLIDDVKVSWTHIGDGQLHASVERQCVEKLGKKPNIEYSLLGQLPNSEVKRLLETGEYDYFITVTKTEGGVPVSIAEACSFGIPVIATAVGGVPELVSGENGMLMPANPTAQEVADTLTAAAAVDEQKYCQMRASSMRKWRDGFCASENAQKFTQKLLELCDEAGTWSEQ